LRLKDYYSNLIFYLEGRTIELNSIIDTIIANELETQVLENISKN